jgi:hypothetical protein
MRAWGNKLQENSSNRHHSLDFEFSTYVLFLEHTSLPDCFNSQIKQELTYNELPMIRGHILMNFNIFTFPKSCLGY